MSLSKLSTELDSKIAAYLVGDTQSLSAFSKVSKYYRTIAEPCLYKDLVFPSLDNYHIRCLLVTVLDRPNVGLHIGTFSLGHTHAPYGRRGAHEELFLRKKLWDRANQIRDKIDQVMRTTLEQTRGTDGIKDMSFCVWWVRQCHESHDVDPVAALIMCFALNLESLSFRERFESYRYKTVRRLLRLQGQDRPFHKLRKLSIFSYAFKGTSFIGIFPGLESLRAAEKKEDYSTPLYLDPVIMLPDCLAPVKPTLTSLHFDGLDISPDFVMNIIMTPSLANLRSLGVLSCAGFHADHPEHWNYPALLRALEKYTPTLRDFTWTGQRTHNHACSFDTFENLLQLHGLAVDYQLLSSNHDAHMQILPLARKILPQSLTELTVSSICVADLDHIIAKESEISGAVSTSASASLGYLHGCLSFRRLTLELCLEVQAYDPHRLLLLNFTDMAIESLRRLADELVTRGIKLTVTHLPGQRDHCGRILVEPGFTAEIPYSGSYDIEGSDGDIQEEAMDQGEESDEDEESDSDMDA